MDRLKFILLITFLCLCVPAYADRELSTETTGICIGCTSAQSLLNIQANEGNSAVLTLDADDGDDAPDTWKISSTASDNDLDFINNVTTIANLSAAGIFTTTGITASSALIMPSGANPTVDAAGKIAQDTTKDQLVYGASAKVMDNRRVISIPIFSPTASSFPIIKLPFGFTVSSIKCIVDPADSSESVTADVKECDSSGDNCVTLDAPIVCSNTGSTDDGSLSNPGLDTDDWMSLTLSSVTGTVSSLVVTITGTVVRE